MAISITKHNFKQEIEESKKPVVIDVYATWCGPCQHMTPIFEEIEQELSDKFTFAKLNVDEAREIAISYQISSVPTFLFLKNGEVLGKEFGYMSKEELRESIEEALN